MSDEDEREALERELRPLVELATSSLVGEELTRQLSGSLLGDERDRAHLMARLSLDGFAAESEAYRQARAWRLAVLEVLGALALEGGRALITAGVRVAAAAMEAELREGVGGLGEWPRNPGE